MFQPIKIAQLGIGHNHGDATMDTLRRFPEYFEVVGVAEDDPVWLEKRRGLPMYRDLPFMSEEELLSLSRPGGGVRGDRRAPDYPGGHSVRRARAARTHGQAGRGELRGLQVSG